MSTVSLFAYKRSKCPNDECLMELIRLATCFLTGGESNSSSLLFSSSCDRYDWRSGHYQIMSGEVRDVYRILHVLLEMSVLSRHTPHTTHYNLDRPPLKLKEMIIIPQKEARAAWVAPCSVTSTMSKIRTFVVVTDNKAGLTDP